MRSGQVLPSLYRMLAGQRYVTGSRVHLHEFHQTTADEAPQHGITEHRPAPGGEHGLAAADGHGSDNGPWTEELEHVPSPSTLQRLG